MQAMLAAFLQTNTKNNAIQSAQSDRTGRTYPPLFTVNLPKEEEIIDDLREITMMEYVVQVIAYQMGRLCGGAHEISGIKVQIFLCGWVQGGGSGGGGVGGGGGGRMGSGGVLGVGVVAWVMVEWGWWGGWWWGAEWWWMV